MNRWMYRAQVQPGKLPLLREALVSQRENWKTALIEQGAETCSIFAYGHSLFVYVEASFGSKDWGWPEEVRGWLEPWLAASDGQLSYQALMPNVFYDGTVAEVQSGRQQRGQAEQAERVGSVAFLKPEMVSSYVFYHYQMQEEKPGSFNQSYCIGLHGELIFSYHESPALKGPSRRTGKLTTANTPANWHEVMAEHFAAGQTADSPIWTKTEVIFSY